MKRIAIIVIAVLIVAGAVIAGVLLTRDDEAEKTGSCADASVNWDLSAEEDDGRLEVNYELNGVEAGEKWQIALTDDGKQIFDKVVTADNEGELEAEALLDSEAKGPFEVTAKPSAGGDTCTAKVSR